MSKVNLLWEKARRAGLAEGKLERLYSKLKVQDKDELTMKKLKTEGGDKDGIKDAEDRRRCCSRQRSGADQGALQGQEADQALGKG